MHLHIHGKANIYIQSSQLLKKKKNCHGSARSAYLEMFDFDLEMFELEVFDLEMFECLNWKCLTSGIVS